MKIDFVSDIVCPWCAIGLASFEQALARVKDTVDVDVHIQPFELNPQMGPEGEDIVEHLTRKYGISPEQVAANRENIRQRGAAVGFAFGDRARTYNTFDAHRLLYWIEGDPAKQLALKRAFVRAYHGDGEDPSDHAVLLRLVGEVGLDVARAKAVLDSDAFAAEVRQRERLYTDSGIHAVPSVIVNDRHLIQGGQPVEAYEQALRAIAAETA
jgi:predicted DsbA family dithiol-disulfide isomerase